MGDYRDKSGSERVDAPEKIDLTNIMLDVYHGVKRLWWLLIGLIIICAVQSKISHKELSESCGIRTWRDQAYDSG